MVPCHQRTARAAQASKNAVKIFKKSMYCIALRICPRGDIPQIVIRLATRRAIFRPRSASSDGAAEPIGSALHGLADQRRAMIQTAWMMPGM
jgi:hypothetical protein